MNSVPLLESLKFHAVEIEELLSILANRRRLSILCHLISEGELPVGELAKRIDLAQSALSQHLALMRHAGIVSTRREGTTIYYSMIDDQTHALIQAIHHVICMKNPLPRCA